MSLLKSVRKKYGQASVEYLSVVDEYQVSLIDPNTEVIVRPLDKSLLEPLLRVAFAILDKDQDGFWNANECHACLIDVLGMELDEEAFSEQFLKLDR